MLLNPAAVFRQDYRHEDVVKMVKIELYTTNNAGLIATDLSTVGRLMHRVVGTIRTR